MYCWIRETGKGTAAQPRLLGCTVDLRMGGGSMDDPISTRLHVLVVDDSEDYVEAVCRLLATYRCIGTVGQADPDLAPHLHFEIRPKGRATDPLTWLQQRGR